MANLFSKAKKSAPATKTKATDKLIVKIDSEDFFENVKELEVLNKRMKSDKAKADILSDSIKEVTKEEWGKLYSERGKNPGSVIFSQEEDGQYARVMFVPMDKYIKIDEERKDALQEKYGDDIVSEETEFGFDAKMIEKYGEILSNLIMECDEIDEKDKEKIITATTKFNVAKGTLDKLADYGDLEEVMEDVNPVLTLKNVEVING